MWFVPKIESEKIRLFLNLFKYLSVLRNAGLKMRKCFIEFVIFCVSVEQSHHQSTRRQSRPGSSSCLFCWTPAALTASFSTQNLQCLACSKTPTPATFGPIGATLGSKQHRVPFWIGWNPCLLDHSATFFAIHPVRIWGRSSKWPWWRCRGLWVPFSHWMASQWAFPPLFAHFS